jgi:hypothetical protein
LFLGKQFKALGKNYHANLLHIFPQLPAGYGQTAIERRLKNIRNQRNRIAHGEAIIFDKKANWAFSFADIDRRKDNVIELTAWLGVPFTLIAPWIKAIEQQKTRTHI